MKKYQIDIPTLIPMSLDFYNGTTCVVVLSEIDWVFITEGALD